MSATSLLLLAVLLLLVLMGLWARGRARRIRQAAAEREARALAAVRAGADPLAVAKGELAGDTVFEPNAPTSLLPARDGIEVAEVLDIDELLRGESDAVAQRARAQLEEPTNIHSGDTLPPRPATAAPAAQQAAESTRAPLAGPPQARAASAPQPSVPAVAPAATACAAPGEDVPLRELVLAWFEARGYRPAAASPVVRPIELVLRHKNDPARAYAFVVDTQRVTIERVQQLTQLARGIGLIRVLVVADAGLSPDVPQAKRGVRVLDRTALQAELARLDLSVAAKIIAVARKRAAARAMVRA
ncbi:MAG: hypothetical protein RMK97_06435 [Sutterellaceae bacterium]|nr:hypothetical protein [Burkholderiaceae bacterium]MCX7901500.1 hypothetical protein [Burkholderiaceae bacterium]MDW8430125.1 hypothetical protein [Sutterellaceae bacterium]